MARITTMLFPIIFSTVLILIAGLIQVILFRALNPAWWRKPWIRRFSWCLPLVGLLGIFFWFLGEYTARDWLGYSGAFVAAMVFILEVSLLLSLPISGLIHGVNHLVDRFRRHRPLPPERVAVSESRRLFLKSLAAAAPIVTVASGTGGLLRAFGPVRVDIKPMRYPNLPPDLQGLRVLHLSDTHLRHYVTVRDLETILESVAEHSPDIVCVVGDVSDDLYQLPEALDLISQLRPKYGTYAVLGNHEYFRGIQQVRKIYDASPIPLLVNAGQQVTVGSTPIYVAGIDDPRHMREVDSTFFERSVDNSLTGRTDEAFTILMSHRPNAFDATASRRIPLTLAGHTHGGQIGFLGRSVFEPIWHDQYLWGEYEKNGSRLYTSAGAGHWFPFRLGCPPEAPILELVRG